METVEELVAAPPCHNKDLSPIAKGKRTKRHRLHSPIPFTITPPTIAGEFDTTTTNNSHNHRLSPRFSAASSEESTTTEEEDTARCLILLARGHFQIHSPNKSDEHDLQHDSKQNNSRKRHADTTITAATTADKGGGACLYACKTCNRVFPSFQALGGHRASHKKPKNEKKTAILSDEEDFPSPSMLSSKKRMPPNYVSLQLSNISTATASASAAPKPFPSPRIHECSYCGAEFTSGQALGGHMRRHRAGPISPSSNPGAASVEEPEPEEPKKPRNGLSLDLNLPAPEDENQRYGFAARQQKSPEKMVLSTTTPTLVDCHY
ncbi:hypothetical protein Pfo_027177 [Paulownia fortunei]|nr:hypothetical protein Pfo_027177 [Paulownia fortunei]